MMDQEDFDRILKKYLRGEETDEERRLVEEWYAAIDDAKPQLTRLEKWRLKGSVWQKIKGHKAQRTRTEAVEEAPVRPLHRRSWALPVAACLCVIIYIVWFRPGNNAAIPQDSEIVTNEGAATRVVALADGSRVTISPGGSMRMEEAYNVTTREVFLTGEAFFEVKKDPSKPFLVHTGDVTTKVLGTSFTVNARKPDVVVSVKTGRVSVFSNKKSTASNNSKAEITLTPNQQAVYHAMNGTLSRTLVEEPLGVIAGDQDAVTLTIESAPVPQILEELSKSYKIPIEYNKKALSTCTLSTVIDYSENIYKRLDIICDAIGATYRVDGVVIRISGTGCPTIKETKPTPKHDE
jgi:transmembrane sensor